jgi:MFS family permease
MSERQGLLPAVGGPAWLALGMNALSCVGSGLTVPFLLIYLNHIRGLSLTAAGLILALSGFAGIVSTPFGGWVIDRIGPLRGFVIGLLLAGLAMGGFGFVTTPETAMACALGYGAANGFTYSGLTTLLAELAPARERSAVFGLRFTTANLGFGAGALVSGLVLDFRVPLTFTGIFVGDAVSYFLFAASLLLLQRRLRAPLGQGRAQAASASNPERQAGSAPERRGYGAVLRDRVLVLSVVIQTVFVFVLFESESAFPVWAVQLVPSTPAVVGAAFAANMVGLVLSQLFVLRLIRGRTRTGAAALSGLILTLTWGLILAAAFLPSHLQRGALLVFSMGVMGVGAALLAPTLVAVINDVAPDQLRGRYNAVYHLSAQVAPLAAPALAGWALGHGLGIPLMSGLSGASLAASALTLWLGRIVPRPANLVPAPDPPRRRPVTPPTGPSPTVSVAGGE